MISSFHLSRCNTVRSQSDNLDFINLVKELDKELVERYPETQHLYLDLNKVGPIGNIVIAYYNGIPAGCGCFKIIDNEAVEIKRMFVKLLFRGKKLSKIILTELLSWSIELGYSRALLETGKNQPEAIGLYEKTGFQRIQNFGPYKNMDNSFCFEKLL